MEPNKNIPYDHFTIKVKSVPSKGSGQQGGKCKGSKGKGEPKRKGKCNNDIQCPEGYVCIVQRIEKSKKVSEVKKCTFNIDDCENVTCSNNGSCIDLINNFTCQCVDGFTGRNCETNVDECRNVTCMHEGTCLDGVNNYTCQCKSGFEGKHCEKDIDDCENVTCSNYGSCIDLINNFTCQCVDGFTGRNCETNINDCENVICMHEGICIDEVNGYKCQCKPGYEGRECEIDVDECRNVTCMHDGICLDGVNNYTCQCKSGFEGKNCEKELLRTCADSPCVPRAQCSNLNDGYMCTCNPDRPISNFITLNASSTPNSICSPEYPLGYGNNVNIQWNIIAGAGEKIEVIFTDFETEEKYDSVYVRDGQIDDVQFCLGVFDKSIDPNIGIYTYDDYDYQTVYDQQLAEKLSQPILSSTNTLSILFTSDSVVFYRGFCFTYIVSTV